MRMFITSKNKYLSNDMKIFGTCSIPLSLKEHSLTIEWDGGASKHGDPTWGGHQYLDLRLGGAGGKIIIFLWATCCSWYIFQNINTMQHFFLHVYAILLAPHQHREDFCLHDQPYLQVPGQANSPIFHIFIVLIGFLNRKTHFGVCIV